LLERVAEAGALAPRLWPLEAKNGLLVAERRGRLDAARRYRLVGFLRALPISLDDETADQAWTTTLGLAERPALSAYDAAYLELAQRRRRPLASWMRTCEPPPSIWASRFSGVDQAGLRSRGIRGAMAGILG
jgi:predicted nucleic acid-binding protein